MDPVILKWVAQTALNMISAKKFDKVMAFLTTSCQYGPGSLDGDDNKPLAVQPLVDVWGLIGVYVFRDDVKSLDKAVDILQNIISE